MDHLQQDRFSPASLQLWIPRLEDGWFLINNGKGPSLENNAPKLPQMHVKEWTRDDFDDDKLNLNWEFVRNPSKGNYSLTERKGYFRIWTQDGTLSEIRAKNTLLRREQELCYTAQTKLEFNPTRNGEQAGITCYYSTVTYVRFSLCFEDGRKLMLVINRNHGEEVVTEVDGIPEGAVYLKVETEYLTRRFYYGFDGNEWILAGTIENCIFLCDEGVPEDRKRHTGTLVGIYANNGGCGSRIPADFDYFEYRDMNTGRC